MTLPLIKVSKLGRSPSSITLPLEDNKNVMFYNHLPEMVKNYSDLILRKQEPDYIIYENHSNTWGIAKDYGNEHPYTLTVFMSKRRFGFVDPNNEYENSYCLYTRYCDILNHLDWSFTYLTSKGVSTQEDNAAWHKQINQNLTDFGLNFEKFKQIWVNTPLKTML